MPPRLDDRDKRDTLAPMGTVRLQSGRVKPVWAGHPWIYAQAIAEIEGAPGAGDVVSVVDPSGRFLGRGFYSPKSAIPVRIITRDPAETLNELAIAKRIESAQAFRRQLGLPSTATNGYRLVHAEGDSLPGLIIDVFGDAVVVQLLTAGMKRRDAAILAHIARITGAKTVIEAAASMKQSEGFETEWQIVRGTDINALQFTEREFEFDVPTSLTQKTGYYFDQRETRARVESLSKGRRVLDAYAYLGGMGLAAARGGAASVVSIDSSASAIAAGSAIARHHGLDITYRREDVKRYLPDLYNQSERFDLVVIDPPKLVPTKRHREAGLKAYSKLNQNAMRLVESGGIFVSCSCSGALSSDDLLGVVAESARRVGRRADVFHIGGASPDHPSPAAFRQGRYLKTVFARLTKDG